MVLKIFPQAVGYGHLRCYFFSFTFDVLLPLCQIESGSGHLNQSKQGMSNEIISDPN